LRTSRASDNRKFLAYVLVLLSAAGLSCRQDMHDQPRIEPLQASTLFADGKGARPMVEGTVARGQLRTDRALYQGREGANVVAKIPIAVTRETLARGRERFNIYCSPCHGRDGDGGGMIVQRGFRQPPTYHSDRLREAPDGHYFDVITNGFGAMASYANRVEPIDRWAIIAYIRALQLSQNARIEDVPENERGKLGTTIQ
jgi:mono/diheme cytochrome c family protein